MGERPALRASDGDRERAAADIREHFAQGRARLTTSWRSGSSALRGRRRRQSWTELRADLPPLPRRRRHRRAEPAERRGELSATPRTRRPARRRRLFLDLHRDLAPLGRERDFWPAWLL